MAAYRGRVRGRSGSDSGLRGTDSACTQGSCGIIESVDRVGEGCNFCIQLGKRVALPFQNLLLRLPDLLRAAQVGDQLVDRRSYIDSLPCTQGGTQRIKMSEVAMS